MKGTALSYSNKGPITHPGNLTKQLGIKIDIILSSKKIGIIHDKKNRKFYTNLNKLIMISSFPVKSTQFLKKLWWN